MATAERIEDTEEAWETGQLGEDERFVAVAEDANQGEIDEALGLKMISIRLEKDLIEDFKNIASLRGGMGYQTLMRQVLKRFADCEKKQILREMVAKVAAERAAESEKALTSARIGRKPSVKRVDKPQAKAQTKSQGTPKGQRKAA